MLGGCAAQEGEIFPTPSRPSATPSPSPASESPATASSAPAEPTPAAAFDAVARSRDDPTSLWVVSNKTRPLTPLDYAPTDLSMPQGIGNANGHPLRAEAARALETMHTAATAAGLSLRITSAYRDFAYQTRLYNGYVGRDGQAAADTYSARPGYSEHQTGLATDLDDSGSCGLQACFAQTATGAWLAEHAPEYGFILRYPDGKQGVTGFTFEPWHFRYVGTDLALEMRRTGVTTLEEFFGLPAAPDYLR
ncbi:M15 family metallopeptidase [Klugiella xanthotipulae]